MDARHNSPCDIMDFHEKLGNGHANIRVSNRAEMHMDALVSDMHTT